MHRRAPRWRAARVAHATLGAHAVADNRNGDITEPGFTFQGVLGSLLAVTDATGNALATYSYGPYGEVLEARGSQTHDYDWLYSGKPYDRLSGLSYYGLRYYDAP